jgi:hypothetical protein
MKNRLYNGLVYPGLQLEVFDFGKKTLVNVDKQVLYYNFGIQLTRDFGNLAAKLVVHKWCGEMEKICANVQPGDLGQW